jgi:hypothetical protein
MTTCSRTLRALVVAALVAIGVSGGDTAMAGQDPLQWGPCPPSPYGENPPSQECTTVSVPLNYDEPGGRRIDIAVSRLKATAPDKRRGVLLLNPGGPETTRSTCRGRSRSSCRRAWSSATT